MIWLNQFDQIVWLWPLVIFLSRTVDVALGTIRTICVVRGHRYVAPLLGFFEVTIWVIAVSGVIQHLDHWWNIVAYGGGFAMGTIVGMALEDALAMGHHVVRLISRKDFPLLCQQLRQQGFPITEVTGCGKDGSLGIGILVVPRRDITAVMQMARTIDANVLITVEDVRYSNYKLYKNQGPWSGWRAILKKK